MYLILFIFIGQSFRYMICQLQFNENLMKNKYEIFQILIVITQVVVLRFLSQILDKG